MKLICQSFAAKQHKLDFSMVCFATTNLNLHQVVGYMKLVDEMLTSS